MIIRNSPNHGLKVGCFKEENLLILFGHFSISVNFFLFRTWSITFTAHMPDKVNEKTGRWQKLSLVGKTHFIIIISYTYLGYAIAYFFN